MHFFVSNGEFSLLLISIHNAGIYIILGVYFSLVCVSLSVIVEVRMVRRKFFSFSRLTEMGCCSCFGFLSKSRRQLMTICGASSQYSQEFLLPDDADVDGDLYNGDSFFMPFESNGELQRRKKVSEEILLHRIQSGMICREIPVKETRHVIRTEVIFFLFIFFSLFLISCLEINCHVRACL